MSFSDHISDLDSRVLDFFGPKDSAGADKLATFHFADGSADVSISYIVKNPALDDSFVPGSTDGTGTLMLFVRFASAGSPQNGDTATVNGVDYDVIDASPDREGGTTVKLRKRGQRWDR